MQNGGRVVDKHHLILLEPVCLFIPDEDVVFVGVLAEGDLLVVRVEDLHQVRIELLIVEQVLGVGGKLLALVLDQAALLVPYENDLFHIAEVAENVVHLRHRQERVLQPSDVQNFARLVLLDKQRVYVV